MPSLIRLHTVWMYWTGEDALELHGAVDDNTHADNPSVLDGLITEAGEKVGAEHVRVIQVEVDWKEICDVFETPKIEGAVARGA